MYFKSEKQVASMEDMPERLYARIEHLLTEKLDQHQLALESIIIKRSERGNDEGFCGDDSYPQKCPTECCERSPSMDYPSGFDQAEDSGVITCDDKEKDVDDQAVVPDNDVIRPRARLATELHEQAHFREEKFDIWLGDHLGNFARVANDWRLDFGDRFCIRAIRFRMLESIVDSHLFDMFVMFSVVANTVYIGAQVDSEIACVWDDYAPEALYNCLSNKHQITWTELLFNAFFAVELLIRLLAMQGLFFIGEDWNWNLLDLFLVFASLGDALAKAGNFDMVYIRMLRLMRMLRGAKVIRVVRFFSTFRLMLHEFMKSLFPLVWAGIFIALITYVFSLIVLQGIITNAGSLDDETMEQLRRFFASVPKSLLSLYMFVSGGVSWIEATEPLLKVSTIHVLIIVFYVTLVLLVCFNVITATFVEEAHEIHVEQREHEAHENMLRTKATVRKYRRVFERLDVNSSGFITKEEFERDFAEHEEVREFFDALKLDVTDAGQIFDLIDADETGQIELEEFFVGCTNIKGLAKAANIEAIIQENKRILRKLERTTVATREEMREGFCSMAKGGRNVGIGKARNKMIPVVATELFAAPTRPKSPAPAPVAAPLAASPSFRKGRSRPLNTATPRSNVATIETE